MNAFHLARATDWPPELHKAADRYELAIHAGAKARYAHEMNAAITEQKAAKKIFGAACLALDKVRRPAFYADKA